MAAAAPAMSARALLLCLVVASLALSSSAQSCTSLTFSRGRSFALCNSLRRLGASLHWTYHPSNATVDIAFRAPQSSNGWVAWGINPEGPRMVGTQALVAFQNPTTGNVAPYTSPVTGARLQPANISIPATNLQGEFSGGAFTIYATLRLTNNRTQVSHVWQSSTAFSGGFPFGHPTTGENVQSTGTLDFLSGESASGGSPAPSAGSPAPSARSPAPSAGSPAPSDRSPAPSAGSPAPSDRSPAPTAVSPAPSNGSPAPSDGSPAPSAGNSAPSDGSPAPSGGGPPPSGATPLLAHPYVYGCTCMFGWMLMYVVM